MLRSLRLAVIYKNLSLRLILGIGLAILTGSNALAPLITQAQSAGAVITIAVPDSQKATYKTTIIPAFSKANPSITVQVVSQTDISTTSAATDVGTYLDAVQKFVAQADVSLVSGTDLSAEATRAGYYLNMQPLVDADQSLNQSDFYPNVFRAFQWDQGTWALPLSVDPFVLSYDTDAFDKAGLNYPTPQWTLDDLIAAVKKLTTVDQSGAIVTPGLELFRGNNDIPLYMSLIGKPLYDSGAIPNPPNIDQPEVETLLDSLTNLFKIIPAQSTTFSTAPIQIGTIRQLTAGPNNSKTRKEVVLPGGHAYLDVAAVAISGSTQYPDAAYKLAAFLTTQTDAGNGAGFGNAYSARQSLVSQSTSSNGNTVGPGAQAVTSETQQVYNDAIASGYSASDRRFYDYVGAAITDMNTNKSDSKTALANAQSKALQAQQTAVTRKSDASKVAVIATPLPTLVSNAGITLKFGYSDFRQIPNQAAIQELADQFAQQSSGAVARVDIGLLGAGPNGTTTTSDFDCYYLPYSNVPNLALNTTLNLDPYLTADKNYSASDFLSGALTQVTRDNKIWALPMNIQPTVMWYDPTAFANAGLPKPTAGWDISAFNVAVKGLSSSVAAGTAPFAAQSDTGSTLLMLVAAYGGLPIDYRTTPVTVNFTDKANIDAMQQVLDLAKNKLIDYKALASNLGFSVNSGSSNPIYSQELNGLNFQLPGASTSSSSSTSNYVSVTFPKGGKYQMMAYSVGTLYINATAQNPDACYKWISQFSQHPELTNAMPARNSLLTASTLDTSVGTALAQAYRAVGTILNDPNTIGSTSLVGGFANLTNTAIQHWLFEAWDNYVLNGQDLSASLDTAQQYASGFLQCYASIPAYDSSQQKYSDYQALIAKCVTKIDPRLSSILG